MKAFNGFKSEPQGNKPKMLPAGAYVARIKAVKIDGQEPDQTLVLRMDVVEGEHTDYFTNRYKYEMERKNGYEPRYKGDFRLRIPNEANTRAMYPETDQKRFNDAIWRIEKSNEGYHWDWNEQGLVGLIVGINMQEGEYNGSPFTKIGRLEVAEDVRRGIVQPMRPSKPRGDAYEPPVDQQSGFVKVDDDSVTPPWF